jgi:uncharacterized repeat protein (TIGR03803 family)
VTAVHTLTAIFLRALLLAACAVTATLALTGDAWAKKSFHLLHKFDGADGTQPYAGLIIDNAGNLYGTAQRGGAYAGGTVFKFAPDGTLTTLHSFDSSDGKYPLSDLIADAAGNLYGTTLNGGSGCQCGTVFKLAPDNTETVLHLFKGTRDGRFPLSGLVMDGGGNLYGTTPAGGGRPCNCGVVFKITPDGTETILHVFGQTQADGREPLAALILDDAGNLFGTASGGGSGGNGVVFELAPDGKETIIHNFTGSSDGIEPVAPLISDSHGNLYGTTRYGGGTGCEQGGCGTVFRIAANGDETILYAFKGNQDGYLPDAGLLMDKSGNLYGTTEAGGGIGCHLNYGCGTVFKVAPDGTETVLHAFDNAKRAAVPLGRLVADPRGRLSGTTSGGDMGQSTIFRVVAP